MLYFSYVQLVAAAVVLYLTYSSAYRLSHLHGAKFACTTGETSSAARGICPLKFSDMGDVPGLDDKTEKKIQDLITNNKVVLFMKGVNGAPQCGFSDLACRILNTIETPFQSVNVLDDDYIRAGIKVFSSWPTIPQLYVDGEFVGGSDIMLEMYESGELAELIEVTNAS